jgi:hypothetical protein
VVLSVVATRLAVVVTSEDMDWAGTAGMSVLSVVTLSCGVSVLVTTAETSEPRDGESLGDCTPVVEVNVSSLELIGVSELIDVETPRLFMVVSWVVEDDAC